MKISSLGPYFSSTHQNIEVNYERSKIGHNVSMKYDIWSHLSLLKHSWNTFVIENNGKKRETQWMDYQEVSRCTTRGESEESIAHRWQSMHERGFTLVCHQKSEIRVPVAPQSGLMFSKKWVCIHSLHQRQCSKRQSEKLIQTQRQMLILIFNKLNCNFNVVDIICERFLWFNTNCWNVWLAEKTLQFDTKIRY